MSKSSSCPFLFALLAALLYLAAGCGGEALPPAPGPPVVTVAAPVEQAVADRVDFSGKTVAVESVQLRARVGGYLLKFDYKEGDAVKLGQVLFEIDPRPYQAELDAALAQVKVAQALVTQTESAYQRAARLRPGGSVSQEELEKALRTRDVAVASLDVARSTVAVKQLNLGFTKVVAPIDGRADKADVTVGNLVSANLNDATVLTNIVRLDPMYAYFDVDELTMLRLLERVQEGKMPSREEKAPEVLLGLGNGEDYPVHGTIDFVGNQVDPSTGTLTVRGVFPNKDRVLAPGLFARLRLSLGGPHPALLVNDRALGTDQGQKFLFVVNDQNEVAYRAVTVGALHGGLREVTAGLKPGERVVINGLMQVRPGITVEPKPGMPLRHPPGFPGRLLRQRLQQVRSDLAGQRPGRRRLPPRPGHRPPAEGAQRQGRDDPAGHRGHGPRF
jgi:RND family efflux transporter MFP subunit